MSDIDVGYDSSLKLIAFLLDDADFNLEISLCHCVESCVQIRDTGRECDYMYNSNDLLCLKTDNHLSISVGSCYQSLLTHT